ncbi:hypothetical protein HK104_006698 [Borealophlyctis nickersoniae]|nr:hypothetical protein HK104_006698 [Borealophlyctis nickersoniae]
MSVHNGSDLNPIACIVLLHRDGIHDLTEETNALDAYNNRHVKKKVDTARNFARDAQEVLVVKSIPRSEIRTQIRFPERHRILEKLRCVGRASFIATKKFPSFRIWIDEFNTTFQEDLKVLINLIVCSTEGEPLSNGEVSRWFRYRATLERYSCSAGAHGIAVRVSGSLPSIFEDESEESEEDQSQESAEDERKEAEENVSQESDGVESQASEGDVSQASDAVESKEPDEDERKESEEVERKELKGDEDKEMLVSRMGNLRVVH